MVATPSPAGWHWPTLASHHTILKPALVHGIASVICDSGISTVKWKSNILYWLNQAQSDPNWKVIYLFLLSCRFYFANYICSAGVAKMFLSWHNRLKREVFVLAQADIINVWLGAKCWTNLHSGVRSLNSNFCQFELTWEVNWYKFDGCCCATRNVYLPTYLSCHEYVCRSEE